jgi:hypothetical protein
LAIARGEEPPANPENMRFTIAASLGLMTRPPRTGSPFASISR